MASVTISDAIKKYGALQVLHGINLDIRNGQFIVLLGPSGCGKSTLLRMIAGLEEVTAGEISIGGSKMNDVHPKDRNIAMVFQNYALYAHMSVRENMAFSMRLKKVDKSKIAERVGWAAKILSLEPFLDRMPRELSGGQRQRVAMGRAIVRNPDVFLFDEPLSNLDAKLRVQMRTEIKELHQNLKTTTIYVTHDQIEAMTMADVVVIMRDGNIEQVGSPLEVYDNPANLFVAEFIGSPGMNILEGTIGEDSVGKTFDFHGFSMPLPQDFKVHAGQNVLYGIRPEHVITSTSGAGLQATVKVVEPTGPETHIYADHGDMELCSVSRERLALSPQSEVRFLPDIDFVHLFDAKTKIAIPKSQSAG
ncbi:MAG: sn-glycerol-3-phosphate ABC transporter ATP-binding protein UgpC [Roseovarius sp.]|nr:sn-glycerol-3-phosphate ABC transporter ATP-binding protein UgpC [Roseovarius sp.]